MHKFLLATGMLSSVLFAEAPAKPEKTSYDTDLFRENKKVIFVNADFLYWSVDESHLDYALRQEHQSWGPANNFSNGDMKNGHLGWDPGYRVNIGYFNAPHYWDALIEYTFFHNGGSDTAHKPNDPNLFLNPTFAFPFNTSSTLVEAHSSLDFHYHLADLMASRRFFPNPHLRLAILGGVTAAWIEQNWKVHYETQDNNSIHMKNDWRFSGAGLRFGTSFDWFWGRWGLYLSGKATMAVLAGHYHLNNRGTMAFSLDPSEDPSKPFLNLHNEDSRLTFHSQILAGPSWQMAFDSVRIEVFAGYEFNVLSNLHEVYRDIGSGGGNFAYRDSGNGGGNNASAHGSSYASGLLGIQGFTFRLNLDF